MSTPLFTPVGNSIIIAYSDDSTDTSTEVAGASAFLVFNPDAANVVVVSVGAADGDVNAIVPTSGANGSGVVIGPGQQVLIGAGFAQYSAGPVYISVAGVSATGDVYITPGSV